MTDANRVPDDSLERRDRGEDQLIEDLCRTHPELEGVLRQMWQWNRTAVRASDPARELTVDTPVESSRNPRWTAFLDQLRSRGPNWQRYVMKGEIARGGMGVIHRVFDQDARRNLALKVILGSEAVPPAGAPAGSPSPTMPQVDQRTLGRFLEEAQVTSQLDHPGIVPVHEIGVDRSGRVYFTMKLVKGDDLRAICEKVACSADGWSVTRALSVLLKVCEAMSYAHAKGVIHRDLKPANVMVGRYGEVFVMDWGLARLVDNAGTKDVQPDSAWTEAAVATLRSDSKDTPDEPILTADGSVVGTPAYMPPEQAKGKLDELGPQADVYAVGAMLYHLLAGHMPYVDDPTTQHSARKILAMVVQGPPRAVQGVAPDAPIELVAICEKAMARDRGDRYPTMVALAADVRAFLEHRVVAAHQTGAIAELRKWAERNRALAAMTAAAILILFAGLAVSTRLFLRADANASEAARERENVLRLSDAKRLEQLVARQENLWPSFPQNAAGIEQWLRDARTLLARLPEHRATLEALRQRAAVYAEADANRDRETHPDAGRLDELLDQRAKSAASKPEDDVASRKRDAELTQLDLDITALEAKITSRRTWHFDVVTEQWQHDVLSELVSGLAAIEMPDLHGVTLVALEHRLEDTKTIQEESIDRHRADWDDAIAQIAADQQYGGMALKSRIGFVPIGRDPTSHLFEFWHVRSGEQPRRDPNGKIAVADDMGMVFVLIPAGTFWMGAQAKTPAARSYDPQARSEESDDHDRAVEVTLDAFWLSKYEITLAQWSRLFGPHSVSYPIGMENGGRIITASNPISDVSWFDCDRAMRRAGLELPTEAQWEYACRARTDTPWFCGRDKADLAMYGNLADLTAHAASPSRDYESGIDDGYVVHSPVGTFEPNGFGLHDTIGNVWEWCRDGFMFTRQPRPGDGESVVRAPRFRMNRGGSFGSTAERARSAARDGAAPGGLNGATGLRPAASVVVTD